MLFLVPAWQGSTRSESFQRRDINRVHSTDWPVSWVIQWVMRVTSSQKLKPMIQQWGANTHWITRQRSMICHSREHVFMALRSSDGMLCTTASNALHCTFAVCIRISPSIHPSIHLFTTYPRYYAHHPRYYTGNKWSLKSKNIFEIIILNKHNQARGSSQS